MIVYQDRLGTNAWRKLEIQKGDAFHAGSPRMSVRKRVVLRQPVYAENDHFTKTGSGQT